jgi:hypothetical protein
MEEEARQRGIAFSVEAEAAEDGVEVGLVRSLGGLPGVRRSALRSPRTGVT